MSIIINGTTGISGVDGTAGSPALQGNDTNTGVVFGTDTVGVVTGGVQRTTVDSNGRFGIGSTAPTTPLSVRAVSNIATYGNVSANFSDNTTGTLYVQHSSGKVQLGSDSALAFGYGVSATEGARIDTLGRLLVGTSSTSANATALFAGNPSGNYTALYLSAKTTSFGTNDNFANIYFTDSGHTVAASIQCGRDGGTWTSGSSQPTKLVFSTTADGASSPTEHLRINQGGGVKMSTNGSYGSSSGAFHEAVQTNSAIGFSIRCTNGSYADTGLTLDIDRNTTNSTYNFIQASCTGVQTRFAVRDSGNVVNVNNSYGAISDIKLKENIVDASSQWDDLKALQVRKYNFKEGQTHTQIGLVAQEVELISPGLVSESPDRDAEGNDLGTVTKSVNYSVLYMKAVKALQEAMERIEQLEQRLTDAGIAQQ